MVGIILYLYFSLFLGTGLVAAYFVRSPKIPVGVNQEKLQSNSKEALKEAFAN